jgi:hypothetical protein
VPGGVTTIVAVNSSGAFIAIPVSVYSLVQSDVPVGSAVSLTDTVSANVTSVSLPAGTWQISSNVQLTGTAGVGEINAWVSTTSATFPLTSAELTGVAILSGDTTNNQPTAPVGTVIRTFGTTTTVYLSTRVFFGGGSMNAFGLLQCVRLQ